MVCDDERKAARLWKVVQTALLNAEAGEEYTARIVAERDLEELARMVGKLF